MQHISPNGTRLIASFEGYSRVPYNDSNNYATAGYGHLIATRPVRSLDAATIRRFTFAPGLEGERRARELLASDLARDYEPAVRALPVKLNQNQFDALVSFVYNVGPGTLGPSHTIGKALHAGRMRSAAEALLLYDKDARGVTLSGLRRRREAERLLFLRRPDRPRPVHKHPDGTAHARVARFQSRFDAFVKARKVPAHRIAVDGTEGPATTLAVHQAKWFLGYAAKYVNGHLDDSVTGNLAHPGRMGKVQVVRGWARRRRARAAAHRAKVQHDGLATFDGHTVSAWIVPVLLWARHHGWTGVVVSGYRTHAQQWAAATQYAASKGLTVAQVYPSGVYASNHCKIGWPGGAVDVTEYNQLDQVLRAHPFPGDHTLHWAGPTIGDVVHFSSNAH